MTVFLLILAVAAGGTAAILRTQRDQARRAEQAAQDDAEESRVARDRAVHEGRRARDRAEDATTKLAATQRLLRESEAARRATEQTAAEHEVEAQSLDDQRVVLRKALVGDHDGPIVVCDRRDDGRRPTPRVSFGTAAGLEDEKTALQHLVAEADPNGTFPSKVEWRTAHQAWELSLDHLSSVIKRLPLRYGRTRFIHITSTTQTCNSRCLDGVLLGDCKCNCGGEFHGSKRAKTSRKGWHRRVWHHILEKWQRHEFDLDPNWYYGPEGQPLPEVQTILDQRAARETAPTVDDPT